MKKHTLVVFILSLSFSFANNTEAQNHGTGAQFLSALDYAKLPSVNWDTLKKYSPKIKSIGITPYGAANGITMLINPPVGDQGLENSCVGWSVGYTALGILSYPKYNCWNIASRSPNYVYNQVKVNMPNGGCNGGSYANSALDLVRDQGDCSWNAMPYIDGDCFTQPNTTQRNEAAQNRALKWGKLTDAKNVDSMKIALDLGYPVIIQFEVYNSFWLLTNVNGGVWNSNTNGDRNEQHATCIIGYDNNKQMFKAQNQWGTAWGDNGFFWIPYSFVQSGCLAEAYILYITNPLMPMDIIGANGICSNPEQYTISNLPTGSTVTWSVDNTLIANVSTTGLVTKVSNGIIILSASITLCGSTNPVTITKLIAVGGDAVGYFTINASTTQNNLVNGSGSFITAQRGQNVYVHFQLTANNLSNIVWSYDNVTSSNNPFTASFTAPLTGYTNLYKTVYLNATSPCGVMQNYYPFTIMSLGWTYAMIASPNPATGNINLTITTVADTTTNVKIAAVTTSTVLDNSTKIYLYDFNTSSLVKQWNFPENQVLNYNLNIAGIKQGVYVLKMQRDNKITNTKVIVQ